MILTRPLFIAFLLCFLCSDSSAQQIKPYSTNTSQLTIWNGTEYVPFFMKGVNLGISKPGTFPGELLASKQDYLRWFGYIKDAGFNCIRLYTLHFPQFYEAINEYNTTNRANPLLFIQGIWLEEEYTGYQNDLYFLSEVMHTEIHEEVSSVHGNISIPQRYGKAYGDFTVDASQWCLAYIVGREVYPDEVLTTNETNPSINQFSGNHFAIQNASAAEVWFTSMLDYTVSFEDSVFHTQRPVSTSSWPTLDPITHPEEPNRTEDTAFLDLSKVKLVNAPAGFFISYHAYPYYPDFVSKQSTYQNTSDEYGPISYLAYLNDLKSHYPNFPLVIAEYGVPSSWVVAHYASSGMNHGGFDEYGQGLADLRLLNCIRTAACAGGIQFALMDEWFKRTWVADGTDYLPESRILWHNLGSAEQNYGLLAFDKDVDYSILNTFDATKDIQYIKAGNNYDFFETEIGLKSPMGLPGEIWVALDTYGDSLGESISLNGDTLPNRSEFLLHITNYSATLYVTQAYDIFGNWHKISGPQQLYHSIQTDGAPWQIVRLKNNSGYSDVQYIGELNVNYSFQPQESTDGVIIDDKKITIRLPWTYLNVVAPDQNRVLNDDRSTTQVTEDTVTEGFKINVQYKQNWYGHPNRFLWPSWTSVLPGTYTERLKASYYVAKDNLMKFNTPAFVVPDSFGVTASQPTLSVGANDGLLNNDFDLDGNVLRCVLKQTPQHGRLTLQDDGSFTYTPFNGYAGVDTFYYSLFDGQTLSQPNWVSIQVEAHTGVKKLTSNKEDVKLFPNPTNGMVHLSSTQLIQSVRVFNTNGQLLQAHSPSAYETQADLSEWPAGMYFVVYEIGGQLYSQSVLKK
jgi:hypothetical protein